MPVVQIPTPLRGYAGGNDRLEGAGTTVGAVLNSITESFPELKERLFDGSELRRFVNVYLNNEDIRYLDDLDTAVGDKDELAIIPAIAGG